MNDTPGWTSPGSAPADGPSGTPGDTNGSAPQWSQQQPAAGQWQSPTGPGQAAPPQAPARAHGGQGGPGWGAQPPYGQWGMPAAAKPGVIPLRPLTLGEILDGAVTTMRRYWRTVLTVSVTVAVIMQIAETLTQRYLIPARPEINPDAGPAEAMAQAVESMKASLIASIPAYVIMIVATLISAALLTIVISRAVLGRPVDLATAWQEARPRLLQLLGLTLLMPLIGGAVMLIGMLPGMLLGETEGGGALTAVGGLCGFVAMIWLMIRFSLASPALMLERQGVIKALKRSAKLVQGSWWRIFGISVLTQLIVLVVAFILALPFGIIAVIVTGNGLSGISSGGFETSWSFLLITGVGGIVTSAVTYPLLAGVTVLLYIDQRIRREALDIELTRAAGLAGQGG
ncbi:hypothetical protein ACIRSU_33885 [Streptomyces sp. NPDC101160]|uniref:hypothetical protein n=1 Tax=Streptomyces sp. NPDC101160 TaxID=3366118 RepID=UPI00382F978A